MSKVLDMAKDFEQRSKQQANDTEQSVINAFNQHEQAINAALNSSSERISDAINVQNRRLLSMLVTSWLWYGLTAISVLLGLWAVTLYQGEKITDNAEQIAEQEQTLQMLKKKTFGITLLDSPEGRFIVLPKGQEVEAGWTLKKKPAIKLKESD